MVFGTGDAEADLVLVGEAPGRSEDEQGLPFVGAAGRLLTELLAGIGLRRSDVYIANVLKCRPPGNRDPEPLEVESCRPFLEGQLRLLRPKVVLALGNFASRLLLGTREGVTRLRGRVYPFPPELERLFEGTESGGVVVPTYHPAAVLRGRGETLAQMRADFILVKRALWGVGG